MAEYEPELGQAVFGQPFKEHAVSPLLDAALTFIRERLNTVLWNRLQRDADSPFSNSAATFDTEDLSIHAYSWGDDEQPYNFKCGDVEVSWYKYLGRGMSASRDYSPVEIQDMLLRALSILARCDVPLFGEEDRGQPFTYNGTTYSLPDPPTRNDT